MSTLDRIQTETLVHIGSRPYDSAVGTPRRRPLQTG